MPVILPSLSPYDDGATLANPVGAACAAFGPTATTTAASVPASNPALAAYRTLYVPAARPVISVADAVV